MPNTNGGKLLRRFFSSYRKLLDRVAFKIHSHRFTYFQPVLAFFGSADQGLALLKQPRTSSPNWRKPIQLSFTTLFFSTNQNVKIIQACNRKNHKGFQLNDIFPLTSQCPDNYTRFFHNPITQSHSAIVMVRHYLSYLLLHTLFIKLLASPYIIHSYIIHLVHF